MNARRAAVVFVFSARTTLRRARTNGNTNATIKTVWLYQSVE